MEYRENLSVCAKDIADLRESVGWNRMECLYKRADIASYYHIAVYDQQKLIGYIDCVSNSVTDAYIQDLMVHPDNQGKGIGTELMHRMNATLKNRHIYKISVIFEETLKPFYSRFGFSSMLCGQLQTLDCE